MNSMVNGLRYFMTHSKKRFWVSLFLVVLLLAVPASYNILTPLGKVIPGFSGFVEKFFVTGWDVLLFLPLSLWWKSNTRSRTVILWTSFLNLVFLHSYYFIHHQVIVISLLLGWGMPIAYCAYHLLKSSLRHFKDAQYRKYLFISILVWALFALCYPPLPLGPLAFVVFIPWLAILNKVSRGQAITLSFWAGFVHNAIMYYWIYNVIQVGPGPIVAVGLALLLSWFALFTVLLAFLFRRIHRLGHWSLLLFPMMWVGLEVIRTFGEISFPWAHIAYTLGDQDELIQSSAWLGAFGLGFLIIFTNVLGYRIWLQKRAPISSIAMTLLAPLMIVLGLYFWGTQVLKYADVGGPTAKISLIQPSIIQSKKWDKKFYKETINTTMKLLNLPENQGQDLLVLPETAIPNYVRFARKERAELRQLIRRFDTNIFFGILDFDKKGPPGRIYNFYNTGKFYSLHKDSTNSQRTKIKEQSYSKIRLVPFSEKLPWDDLFPVLNYVNLGEGDFRPGTETPVFSDLKWAPNICYETIYPDFVRRNIRSGARLIVNITNDGWFGRSTAPYQHLNLVKFRAVENGIPVARSANTGISAFVDQYGRIIKQTELYETQMIQAEIPLKTRETLYSQIGDMVEEVLFWFFWLGLLGVLALRPIYFSAKQR